MSKLYKSKYHSAAAIIAAILIICGGLSALILHSAAIMLLIFAVSISLFVWSLADPYLHGHWWAFMAFHSYRALIWASKASSWKKLRIRMVYYIIPMLIRVFPICLLPLVPVGITMLLLQGLLRDITDLRWQIGIFILLMACTMLAMNIALNLAGKFTDSFLKKEKETYYPAYLQRLARMGYL